MKGTTEAGAVADADGMSASSQLARLREDMVALREEVAALRAEVQRPDGDAAAADAGTVPEGSELEERLAALEDCLDGVGDRLEAVGRDAVANLNTRFDRLELRLADLAATRVTPEQLDAAVVRLVSLLSGDVTVRP